MQKNYILKGLSSALIAAKAEEEIKKINHITDVQINFFTTKMLINTNGGDITLIEEQIKRILFNINPKVEFEQI